MPFYNLDPTPSPTFPFFGELIRAEIIATTMDITGRLILYLRISTDTDTVTFYVATVMSAYRWFPDNGLQ